MVCYKKRQDALVCIFSTTYQQCARLFSSNATCRACTCNSEQDPVCKWYAYWAVVSTFTCLPIMFCWCPPCMRQFVRMLQRTYWCWCCTCCMHQAHRTHEHRPACVVCMLCWCRPCMRQCVKVSLVHTDVDVTCCMRQYVHQFLITHGRQRFMHQCVHLYSLLTLTVNMSAYKPINAYKLTCLHMHFLLTLKCASSVYTGIYRWCRRWHVYVYVLIG
jgi:hypothetical protein